MEENPNGQRYGIIDSQLIENVSNILGFDTGRHNSTQNSEYWKAKFEEADGTLQSCEKNKKVVEKQNEDLKNENKQTQKAVDDAKMAMAKLCARNEILEDLHKKSEEERNDQCQKITQLEKELTLQKEIVEKMERKLNESQDTVKKETVLRKNLEIVNEKTSLKADALEKYVETLIDIKQLYETRIRNSDTVIAKKENEVKEVTEKHFVQTQKFEELEHDAEKLQNDIQVIHNKFESCCKERDTTEMKFNELREVYVTNSDKLSDECYSLNVSLQRAYNDCEVYCKRIEELEGTLEGLHDTRSLQVEEIDILKTQMNDKDDQISKFKKQESDLKDRQSELEIQSVDHKEEIRKLREMFDVEKAKNETLEHMCGQKVSDYEDYVSKFKDLGSRLQMLETRLKEEKETHSTTLEVKEMLLCENKELQQKLKILEDDCDKNEKKVNDLTRSLILAQDENAKLKKAVEETSEDASKQTNNCQELTAKNQCLSAVNEENEQEIAALKSHLEKLKSQLWTLRERSIEMAAAADVIEKFKERCYVLIEEKNELLAELERLKVDRCRLTRVNEEQREAIWKARQGQSVSQSRIKDLETAVSELREGKEMALQKVEQLQREFTEHMKDSEQRWEQKLKEKEIECEKQLKRKEANEILMRRMDDQLKQKEVQLEVKRGDLKRMLVQCADLKNDKMRCEKKIESLQLTEKTLAGKVEKLEPRLSKLEEREGELITMLKQKEVENKSINEKWEKLATAGVEEIAKAIWD